MKGDTAMKTSIRLLASIACISLIFVSGCKKSVKVPDSPDKVILQGLAALKANKPGEAYALLPKSYQKDVQDLVAHATSKIDKEVFDLGMQILDKARSSLDKHGDAIAKMGMPNVKENLKGVKDVYDLINGAKLLDHGSLSKLNVASFLGKQGPKLMEFGRSLAKKNKAKEYDKFEGMLAKASAKVDKKEGDKATLTLTMGEKSKNLKMVKVEGTWVPEEMAKEWKEAIADAKKNIDRSVDRMMKQKDRTKKMLQGVLAMITEFEKSGDVSKLKGLMRAM